MKMASARKKLDEKNLKILRELVSLSGNKHCLDCGQRGPTYVNVTIGSFVCTSCSGILRGLTPPHRVKSISMATFTQEEIESLKSQGNEYCRKVWLGLYDGDQISKDEQHIKEFMVAKYEKKRYYVKSSESEKILNGSIQNSTPQILPKLPSSTNVCFPVRTSNNNLSRNHNNNFFSSQNSSSKPSESPIIIPQDAFSPPSNTGTSSAPPPVVDNFANFENNPIFNSSSSFIITGGNLDKKGGPPATSEDRYAALKDLDSLMKSQQATVQSENSQQSTSDLEGENIWSPPGNSKVASASTSTRLFNTQPLSSSSVKDLNPFNSSSEGAWENIFNHGNPFYTDFAWAPSNESSNGLVASQSLNLISAKPFCNSGSTPNPFAASNNGPSLSHHSSNPFL